MSDNAIEIALELATNYNLDTRSLQKAIEIMQDRILDAM